jgi:ElaB/YqjD/DUF883 family membrane-anchored ribosome-binding protein
MGTKQDPIPFRKTNAAADRTATQVGHALGTWISALRHQAEKTRYQASRAAEGVKRYWEDVQQPERRESHIWSLVAIAAVAGLLLGLLLPKRD